MFPIAGLMAHGHRESSWLNVKLKRISHPQPSDDITIEEIRVRLIKDIKVALSLLVN